MTKKLNMDSIRLIASFLIVAIHISPFDQINPNFDFFFTRIFCRIAVPIFLMITGYYLIDKSLKDINILKNYTKKILKIYLLSILIYIPINIYMNQQFNWLTIIKDILFNGTMYHLWYFPALILGIWLTYFLIKKGKNKTLIIVFILYILGLLGDSYYGLAEMNEWLRNIYNVFFNIFDYTRNGIFYVPIFLYLGYWIKEKNKDYKNGIIYIILFFLSLTLEGLILHHYKFQRHDSMYLFLIPLMYFLFNYLITNFKGNNKLLRNISTEIYILHPLVIVGIRFISGLINLDKYIVNNHLILYIIVCFTTFLLAIIIEKLKKIKFKLNA